MHREIDNAIKKLKTDVDETESKALVVLDKKEDEIKCSLSEIKQIITNVKKVLNSNDVSLVTSYRSSIAQLRRLPPKLTTDLSAVWFFVSSIYHTRRLWLFFEFSRTFVVSPS